MNNSKYSAIVIGSGISGLYTALKLQQHLQKEILLITKSKLGESNSYYAQGGIVAVLAENKNDSVKIHVKDTIAAGAGLSESSTVEFISKNSDKVIKDLLKFGVEFDRDENGNFRLTKEAAHSVNRILHSGGDATGREIEIALCKALKSNSQIKLCEETDVIDLLVKDNICYGVKVLCGGEFRNIYSDSVIVATGGIGQIYKYTTNPIGATGDGIAFCYRAGAVLRDMEFVQFHPTALAIDDEINNNRFLISEAVRGEGAKLVDKNGYHFMKDYDEREELAPRDIVARANFTQMQKTGFNNVYLDARGIKGVEKRFPTIAKKCLEYGIDIKKDLIPVAPAAHYFMGGIKTDCCGRTSVKNLYAIGECASTGLHGANRLASNSLLECVVCAYEAANTISLNKDIETCNEFHCKKFTQKTANNDIQELKTELKEIMWNNVGIFRSEKSLDFALNFVKNLETKILNSQCYELINMVTVAKLIITSAKERRESRGGHYRCDYLQTDKTAKHSEVKK